MGNDLIFEILNGMLGRVVVLLFGKNGLDVVERERERGWDGMWNLLLINPFY